MKIQTPMYHYKKLNYLYNVHEKFTAGMMLTGWEVKSLNLSHCNIDTAYCAFNGNDFCLLNSKITPVKQFFPDTNADISKVESQPRRLLLNKSELITIQEHLQMKGFTCIPARIYKNEHHLWKIDIAICTGKKLYDKREDIKKRDIERDLRRGI